MIQLLNFHLQRLPGEFVGLCTNGNHRVHFPAEQIQLFDDQPDSFHHFDRFDKFIPSVTLIISELP